MYLDAEVPDRSQQPQPHDVVGVGHRDQRREVVRPGLASIARCNSSR